jgi:hypothetical protein
MKQSSRPEAVAPEASQPNAAQHTVVGIQQLGYDLLGRVLLLIPQGQRCGIMIFAKAARVPQPPATGAG